MNQHNYKKIINEKLKIESLAHDMLNHISIEKLEDKKNSLDLCLINLKKGIFPDNIIKFEWVVNDNIKNYTLIGETDNILKQKNNMTIIVETNEFLATINQLRKVLKYDKLYIEVVGIRDDEDDDSDEIAICTLK